jgi:uncharacterized membrane protein
MRTARVLLVAHAAALAFGLAGMLVALPNPQLWASSPLGVQTFAFGMRYAGSLHIVFGALAMLAFGGAAIGWRRTLVFCFVACALSLGSELIGTGTGWPFGNYAYTEFLGAKVLGRVPFSIPLSWFYMGFAGYMLGTALAARRGLRPAAVWSVVLGAYFLTVWDLVLDPAMAHESLPVRFWQWQQTGPYFGMPVQNLAGWTATGAVFMGLSRRLWRADIDITQVAVGFPLAVYLLNTLFAVVLSAAAGLWPPVLVAFGLSLAPALLAWRRTGRGPARPAEPGRLTSQPAG